MTTTNLTKITLNDFRNFTQFELEFDPRQTLILGNNGQGKTNLLEAISLLSTGKNFQGRRLYECIRFGAQAAHISCDLVLGDEPMTLKLDMTEGIVRYSRNGVKKRKIDCVGLVKSIIFRPEDLELVTGAQAQRRDFLDTILVQVDSKYARALKDYERALSHRNKLILQLRVGQVTRADFIFWDELLIKNGDVITRGRSALVVALNSWKHEKLKGELQYEHSLMSEERLHQYATAEVGAGRTLVGPHKDHLTVRTNGLDTALYGSRGQQRLAVLWLKVASLKFIENTAKTKPILLLDDIFSELDDHNRDLVFSFFDGHQVIMTSAEILDVLPKECKQGKIMTL